MIDSSFHSVICHLCPTRQWGVAWFY
jgi:hypothetical protein